MRVQRTRERVNELMANVCAHVTRVVSLSLPRAHYAAAVCLFLAAGAHFCVRKKQVEARKRPAEMEMAVRPRARQSNKPPAAGRCAPHT